MMSHIRYARSFALLFLIGFHSWLGAAEDRLLAWQVEARNTQMVVLGSMHLAKGDLYPLRKELMSAFAAAETLVVEVDISGPQALEMQQLLLTRGTYPPGESLRDELSPETLLQLEQVGASVGLPLFALERMRPGLVGTLLSVQMLVGLGLNPELGVDKYFLDQARGVKAIAELETAEEQVALLLDIPNPDLYMRQTLSQLDQIEALMEPMVDSWKRGDAQALEKLLLEDELLSHPEFEPLYERMFYARNRTMAAGLKTMLEQGGRYFVVVGAGHLVGEQGIPALLETAGFKVRQI